MRLKLPALPKPPKTYSVTLEGLSGGLDLANISYRVAPHRSPAMKNMCWRGGALASRRGQRLAAPSPGGEGRAAAQREWNGALFFHIGSSVYAMDCATEAVSRVCGGVGSVGGSFFEYGGALYYKTRGAYIRITPASGAGFAAAPVEPYVPVTLINADPATGSGDTYQPENRLSPCKTVWYTAAEGVRDYHLPVKAERVVSAEVNGAAAAFSYSSATGVVSFSAAPAALGANGVRICYEKANDEAKAAIDSCVYAEVYGGATGLCIVMAGSQAQPEAYFWNANHAAMDAGYFPVDCYNLASGPVTGFGRQQSALVIFSENCIGKASAETREIAGRSYVNLPYSQINAALGCDVPGSVQLVENNLVFASRRSGVYQILSTSASGENGILRLSGRIEGGERKKGLLKTLGAGAVSFDDGERYWLVSAGEAWLWDYSISGAGDPSWFYFTNIDAAAFAGTREKTYLLRHDGGIASFYDSFNDFGAAIEREYEFAAQSFGAEDALKNVEEMALTVASETDSLMRLEYKSDRLRREDPLPIRAYSARLIPRNLTYRMLSVGNFAHTVVRAPRALGVKHFSARLYNNERGQDMSVISAKIIFKYAGRER